MNKHDFLAKRFHRQNLSHAFDLCHLEIEDRRIAAQQLARDVARCCEAGLTEAQAFDVLGDTARLYDMVRAGEIPREAFADIVTALFVHGPYAAGAPYAAAGA